VENNNEERSEKAIDAKVLSVTYVLFQKFKDKEEHEQVAWRG